MSQALQQITSIPAPFNMVVIIVLIVSFTGVVTTIIKQARKYASHRHEMDFKRELLDRGLTGDEIERVVQARGPMNESSD